MTDTQFKIGIAALVLAAYLLLINPTGRGFAMSFMQRLQNLIAGEEGLRLEAYRDPVGKWTIGYGHLIQPGEQYHPYGPVKKISKEQAQALFEQDIATAQNCVQSAVTVPINENQRAALVSFVFNVGCGAFRSSRMLRYINAQQMTQAAAEFNNWVYGTNQDTGTKERLAILVARRGREQSIFTA